jgi:type I restriction enzyme S subunit
MPVPPLGEQVRIVEKYESLKTYISNYDTLETAREKLDVELPERLRKSILQMAVEGKLVPQNPDNEPASVLLERIREQRRQLIAEGKMKAPKGGESVIYRASDGGYYEKRIDAKGRESEPVCIDDEIPFEIPESWEWVRLGALFGMQAGKNISALNISDCKTNTYAYPCYGGNGVRGFVSKPNRSGDFPIIGRQGALCGCINRATGEFYATEHAVVVTCFGNLDVSWACLFLEAINLNQYATATAQPGLAVSKIENVLIGLPPLKEQKRIAETIKDTISHLD